MWAYVMTLQITQDNLKSCIKERRVDMCATGLAASTWVNIVMTLLGLSHTLVAGILLVAYYNLKVRRRLWGYLLLSHLLLLSSSGHM